MQHAKSLELKIIEGHPNRAALTPNMETEGQPKRPHDMGKHYGKEAAKHWDNVVTLLIRANVVTSVDTSALVALCCWWQRYQDAIKQAQQITDYTTLESGRVLAAEGKSFENWKKLAVQYGLTAMSRNHVSPGSTDDEIDDFLT